MEKKVPAEKHEIPYRDGDYVGEMRGGLPHGIGTYTCKEFTYIGSWFYGTMSGLGVIHYADGSYYTGAFYADRRHGQGEEEQISAAGKIRYVGGWKNGKKHGRGVEISSRDGQVVRREGVWQDDVLS
jgi:hypothetical protein